MTGRYRGQLISINTWYQGQGWTTGRSPAPHIKQCFQCGTSSHVTDDCPEKEKLCFLCKKPGHLSANCPSRTKRDDKASTKENADTLCFLGEDTVFSHLYPKKKPWSMKNPSCALNIIFNMRRPNCLMTRIQPSASWHVKTHMNYGLWVEIL